VIAGVVGVMDERIEVWQNGAGHTGRSNEEGPGLRGQIELQQLHRRRPSLVVLNRGVRRPVLFYEMRQIV